jgi:diguanylate cyclase (GGDEF)-like protein/PAS domain S-box-containing protein
MGRGRGDIASAPRDARADSVMDGTGSLETPARPREDTVRDPRLGAVMILLSLAYALAALLLPLEIVEIAGAPLVVAGAYFLGLRGGIVVALWSTLVATVAFAVVHHGDLEDYIVTVVGYLVIGVLVGVAVDRFSRQRLQLEEAVEAEKLARKQLGASEGRYRLLFERSADPVYLHGLDAAGEPTRFLAVNDATCALLGYTREELRGLTPRAIDAAPAPGQLRRMMADLLREGSVHYESVRRRRGGELIPVEISSSLTEVDGELVVLSISRDIRERQREMRRLQALTLRDELTGLLNRRGLDVMLPEEAKRAKRSGRPVIVVYGDIDHFKTLNDTYGHDRGDEVLVAVAEALRSAFRETDLIARLGGDEFCVVAEADDIDPARLGERLDIAVSTAGEHLGMRIGLSHGEVTTDWRGLEDPRAALAAADERMYAAKHARDDL